MNDDEIKDILKRIRVIASVGLSADETKDSFGVATYLKRARYTVVPVNPRADRILGSKAYPDLAALPMKIDAVQVFRPSAEALKIVEDAIKIGASVVWMPKAWQRRNTSLVKSRCISGSPPVMVTPPPVNFM